jgi:glycosyltransferase involved in cell wall biosynthesis
MPRPLRIAFLGRTMPAHRGGRGMFHPYLTASALARRGHETHLITTAHPAGVTVTSPMPRLDLHYLAGTPSDCYSSEFFEASAAEFDRLHEQSPFDAALSDSAGAAGLPLYARHAVPIATVCHAGLDMMTTDEGREFFARVQHPLLEASAAVICVARHVADSVERGLASVADRIHVIHNAADPGLFAERTEEPGLRAALGLEGKRVLVYVGRVVPEKGLVHLLRAVSILPEGVAAPAVLVVGPGPHAPQLRALAAALGVALVHVPGAPHHEVPRYLQLADVFVLPTRHHEGLPFSLLEASCCGLPLVASEIGGVSEIVREGENGFLVPPGDERALAARIAALLEDPALRKRMGAAGRRLAAERFSPDANAVATERVLRAIAERAPAMQVQ